MNKQAKGALAAGAAAILLLGGAGTFALWSDEETIGGGTITSGDLSLTPSGSPVWEDVSDITPGVIADIANFLIVPGDVIEFQQAYVVDATGDNLKATLTASSTGITGDADLLARIDTSLAADVGGTPLPGSGGTFDITDANDGDTINVVVTITFDETTPDLVAQNQSIDLANFELALQQVRP